MNQISLNDVRQAVPLATPLKATIIVAAIIVIAAAIIGVMCYRAHAELKNVLSAKTQAVLTANQEIESLKTANQTFIQEKTEEIAAANLEVTKLKTANDALAEQKLEAENNLLAKTQELAEAILKINNLESSNKTLLGKNTELQSKIDNQGRIDLYNDRNSHMGATLGFG